MCAQQWSPLHETVQGQLAQECEHVLAWTCWWSEVPCHGEMQHHVVTQNTNHRSLDVVVCDFVLITSSTTWT